MFCCFSGSEHMAYVVQLDLHMSKVMFSRKSQACLTLLYCVTFSTFSTKISRPLGASANVVIACEMNEHELRMTDLSLRNDFLQ